jgi:hypothetical protein
VDQAVERRQQRRAAGERAVERRGVHAPRPVDARDDGGLSGVPDYRGGRVELQERQAYDEREQARRALGAEHLRADGDAPRLLEGRRWGFSASGAVGGIGLGIFPGCARAIRGPSGSALPLF